MIDLVPGVMKIIILGIILGFGFNSVNPHGLPLIRKSLRETRRFVSISSLNRTTLVDRPKTVSQPLPKPIPKAEKISPKPTAPKVQPVVQVASKPKPKIPTVQKKKIAQALFTTLADAKTLFDNKSAIFIDARPPEDYAAEHIPGAISLFSDEINKLYAQTLGKTPKNTTIVTYCSDPECIDATTLADALVAKGHTSVVILLDGLPGWKDAGYPTEVESK